MFNRSKMGKYHVMVCGTTPCMLQVGTGIFAWLGVVVAAGLEQGRFPGKSICCLLTRWESLQAAIPLHGFT